jgi:hypothetical protein
MPHINVMYVWLGSVGWVSLCCSAPSVGHQPKTDCKEHDESAIRGGHVGL